MEFIDWEGRPAVLVESSAFAILAPDEDWSEVNFAEVLDSGRPISTDDFTAGFPYAKLEEIPSASDETMMIELFSKLKSLEINSLAAMDMAGQIYGHYKRTGSCSYHEVLLEREKSGELVSRNQLDYALSIDEGIKQAAQNIDITPEEMSNIALMKQFVDKHLPDRNKLELEQPKVPLSAKKHNPELKEVPTNVNLTETYAERLIFKKKLMDDRNFSNAMTELFLDRQGWPRPPGWHSVFFFPDSMRPRNGSILLFLALVVAILVF